jgi:hypothetical protein
MRDGRCIHQAIERQRTAVTDGLRREPRDTRPPATASHEHSPVPRDDVHVDMRAWEEARNSLDEQAAIRPVHDREVAARAKPGAGLGVRRTRARA